MQLNLELPIKIQPVFKNRKEQTEYYLGRELFQARKISGWMTLTLIFIFPEITNWFEQNLLVFGEQMGVSTDFRSRNEEQLLYTHPWAFSVFVLDIQKVLNK